MLRHDEYGQETVLNLLLRNYLHYNQYEQVGAGWVSSMGSCGAGADVRWRHSTAAAVIKALCCLAAVTEGWTPASACITEGRRCLAVYFYCTPIAGTMKGCPHLPSSKSFVEREREAKFEVRGHNERAWDSL